MPCVGFICVSGIVWIIQRENSTFFVSQRQLRKEDPFKFHSVDSCKTQENIYIFENIYLDILKINFIAIVSMIITQNLILNVLKTSFIKLKTKQFNLKIINIFCVKYFYAKILG